MMKEWILLTNISKTEQECNLCREGTDAIINEDRIQKEDRTINEVKKSNFRVSEARYVATQKYKCVLCNKPSVNCVPLKDKLICSSVNKY